jgi:hypothetical protein
VTSNTAEPKSIRAPTKNNAKNNVKDGMKKPNIRNKINDISGKFNSVKK